MSDSNSSDTGFDLGREATLSLGGQITRAVIGLVILLLFARELGPKGFGQYSVLLATGMLLKFASGGFGDAIKKRLSEPDGDAPTLLGAGLIAHVIFTLLSVGGLAVVTSIAPFLTLGHTELLAVGAITAANGFFDILTSINDGLGNPGLSHWVRVVKHFFALLIQAPLLFAGHSPAMLILGFAAGTTLASLGLFIWLGRRPRWPPAQTRQSVWSFAVWSIPNRVVTTAHNRGEIILLQVLFGSSVVGLYEAARRLIQPAYFLSASLASPLLVGVSRAYSRGENPFPDIENGMQFAGLVAIPLLFGGAVISQDLLVTLYGPKYADGGLFLIAVSGLALLKSYATPFETVVDGLNRPHSRFKFQTAVTVLKFTVAILVGLHASTWTVLLVYIGAEVILHGCYQGLLKHEFGSIVFTRGMVVQIVSGGIMGGVVYGLKQVIPVTGWLTLSTFLFAGATVYFGVLLLGSPTIRSTVRTIAQTVVSK